MGGVLRGRLAIVFVSILVAALCVVAAAPARAEDERTSRNNISISGNEQFNPANGVRKGSGTRSDPFVISDWQVNSIRIWDTSAYVVIKDNTITNSLTLNWNGDRVTLVDNEIGDLRVNQNVERKGEATSGLIARNKIDVVGQLRHFDGIFEHNTIGTPEVMRAPFFQNRAVNFDGFNGARFRENTIYGYVDVRLHGHHHGSGFGETSHYHGAAQDEHADHMAMDHSKRYHQVWVTNNKIVSPGPWALRYFDQAHSANDRTAASERNEELNKPHVHWTKVHFANNQLVGSGVRVDIFNAEDRNHTAYGTGLLDIRNNVIKVERDANETFETSHGIDVRDARALKLEIVGNAIEWTYTGLPGQESFRDDAGIFLNRFDGANAYLFDNSVAGTTYGIFAADLSESVHWWIRDLTARGVEQDVYYDNSVKNHPKREE